MRQRMPEQLFYLLSTPALVLHARGTDLESKERSNESTGNAGEQANNAHYFGGGIHLGLPLDYEEDRQRSREKQTNDREPKRMPKA
jgi:hypothetical protein